MPETPPTRIPAAHAAFRADLAAWWDARCAPYRRDDLARGNALGGPWGVVVRRLGPPHDGGDGWPALSATLAADAGALLAAAQRLGRTRGAAIGPINVFIRRRGGEPRAFVWFEAGIP